MSDKKPDAEAMAKRLQETLAQRRPRSWRPMLVTAAIALVLLLIPAYLIWYPKPPTTILQVIALDDVFTPDETPRVRAQLLAPPAEQATRRLRGETIVFVEQGQKPRDSMLTSDARGQASADWPITPPSGEYLVRYINAAVRHGSTDRGRLYVWPKETPLLIVDADETLIADKLDDEAAATLAKAHEEGWRIVYLSLAGTTGHDFRKARDWLEVQAKLPKGPVLGRRQYPNQDAETALRRELLKSLQARFKGAHAAVVKSADAASVSKEVGMRTILIGNANAPAEVMQAPTWADVPVRLK